MSRCLELGADIQARDKHGKTSLHYAAEQGHLAIAKLPVEGGTDVDAVDGFGRSPLKRAQYWKLEQVRAFHSEVVVYLKDIIGQRQSRENRSLQDSTPRLLALEPHHSAI